jgi:hypothetical protein
MMTENQPKPARFIEGEPTPRMLAVIEDAEFLASNGCTLDTIGNRLGLAPATIKRYFGAARREYPWQT